MTRRRLMTLLVTIPFAATACSKASAEGPASPQPMSPPDPATAGCPVAGQLEPPRALLLFRRDGCVPPSRLLAFRCAPDEPVVIETGAGTPDVERFVGERWATPVDALPPDAVPLGEGGDLQVFGVPGDPRVLYVGQGDGVTRWLHLPRHRANEPPTAFVIGDSIADGAAPFITAALPGWTVGFDAVIGRGTNSALTIAAEQGATPPDVVVVELGTNDGDPVAFRENAVTILDSLRHVPLVVWQTAHGPLPNIPAVDAHIWELAAQYPNVVVADWNAFVNDAELSSDGVHPAPGHEDLMVQLIAPILTRWLEIANGTGAASCATEAEVAAGAR